MAPKEEKSWADLASEIWAKAEKDVGTLRSKAQAESKELASEIEEKVEKFMKSAQVADFKAEAKELIDRLGSIVNKHTDAPKDSPKAKSTEQRLPLYIEPDGTPRYRKGKWAEKYKAKELEAMKQR